MNSRELAPNRHDLAVASSLAQADQAAASGDFENALSWLGALEAIGEALSEDYLARRQAWRNAIAAKRA